MRGFCHDASKITTDAIEQCEIPHDNLIYEAGYSNMLSFVCVSSTSTEINTTFADLAI